MVIAKAAALSRAREAQTPTASRKQGVTCSQRAGSHLRPLAPHWKLPSGSSLEPVEASWSQCISEEEASASRTQGATCLDVRIALIAASY